MPYVIPTAGELQTRYPAFVDVDPDLIDDTIADAARFVDESWFEEDYQPAIMALAAHMLVEDGATGRDVQYAGVITSSKLGDAQDTYSGLSGSEMMGEYSSTSYGRKYMRIRAANHAGVILL